jgi:hypothetical protein
MIILCVPTLQAKKIPTLKKMLITLSYIFHIMLFHVFYVTHIYMINKNMRVLFTIALITYHDFSNLSK